MRQPRIWVALLVSAAFLGLFFWGIDLREVLRVFQQANYTPLPVAIAIYFLAVWFRSWRWHLLLAPLQVGGVGRLFPFVVIGYMANDVLPARLGELVRAYLLGTKTHGSSSAILATILIERVFDGIALVLFLFLLVLFLPLAPWLQTVVGWAAALFIGGLVVLYMVVSSQHQVLRVMVWGLRMAPRWVCVLLLGLAERFLTGLGVLRSPWRQAGVLLTSGVVWMTEAAMYGVVGYAFGLTLPFWGYLLVTAVANLAITLPSSQGGIGPFEYFALQALLFLGVDSGVAMAYVLGLHALLLVPVTLLGFFFLWQQHWSLSEVLRAIKTRSAPQVATISGRDGP